MKNEDCLVHAPRGGDCDGCPIRRSLCSYPRSISRAERPCERRPAGYAEDVALAYNLKRLTESWGFTRALQPARGRRRRSHGHGAPRRRQLRRAGFRERSPDFHRLRRRSSRLGLTRRRRSLVDVHDGCRSAGASSRRADRLCAPLYPRAATSNGPAATSMKVSAWRCPTDSLTR
jgi:hypothetical protein